ncbi:MAG: hypothetical protein GPJ27_16060 [Microcystis aeruginosa L111-01]|nr:hypothetical protein [Microcystis aeruginosa W13-16]NCQ74943.1 hypothetical protein [Microcystis aeruginosa W13-13]NCQ79394.1 hypothetical protein [Microcystis aeruginosa W13-15]NCR13678.1 hypothetical protein [Microcystis aeruginosa SX13-11]NCR17864.1 hypothetical protein [Microcystis aeruginosa LL13-03]NCR23332.1 hypothetical protein [Microcystis aeruginosa L111-01]NCR43868.1 hypothetical protein [Microcystis aeruginosa SX13-01]NCR67523.1 hypothetical protein [Microcystis aeruginosa LL1
MTTPRKKTTIRVSILVLGYTSESSAPRFSPRVVISETGGGYRRYSHLCKELLQSVLTLSPLA